MRNLNIKKMNKNCRQKLFLFYGCVQTHQVQQYFSLTVGNREIKNIVILVKFQSKRVRSRDSRDTMVSSFFRYESAYMDVYQITKTCKSERYLFYLQKNILGQIKAEWTVHV